MRENRREFFFFGGGGGRCVWLEVKRTRENGGAWQFSLRAQKSISSNWGERGRKWGARGLDEIAQHIQIFINIDLSFSSLLFPLFRSYHSFLIF